MNISRLSARHSVKTVKASEEAEGVKASEIE